MTWEVESSLYEGYGASICDLTRPRGKQTLCQVRTYQDALLIVEAVNTLWPEAASPAERQPHLQETEKTTLPSLASVGDEGGGWRPIETVPRDRFVLLYTTEHREMSGFVAMAKWQGSSWFGVDDEGLTFNPLQAWDRVTHWMPLPEPPALGGAS